MRKLRKAREMIATSGGDTAENGPSKATGRERQGATRRRPRRLDAPSAGIRSVGIQHIVKFTKISRYIHGDKPRL